MRHVTCLITGCNFLDAEGGRWIHGDLHQVESALIFNANGCEWKDCATEPMPQDERAAMSPAFYEKNSQIVFPLELAQFNLAANKYLTENLKAEKSNQPLIVNPHTGRGFH